MSASSPNARILVLSNFEGDEDIHASFEAGASGYILKHNSGEQIVPAMAPGATISSHASVVVAARVSKSGNAMPQKGDVEGAIAAAYFLPPFGFAALAAVVSAIETAMPAAAAALRCEYVEALNIRRSAAAAQLPAARPRLPL